MAIKCESLSRRHWMITRRRFARTLPIVATAVVASGKSMLEGRSVLAQQRAPIGHFDPKGKAPSKYTVEVLKRARSELPFADDRDFEEQRRGLIAPMPDLQIKADAGHVAWDMERFQFLLKQPEF